MGRNDEMIPSRLVVRWRVCVDYMKLNAIIRKDHFLLPFLDQLLERIAGFEFYCFLDGYSDYNQIVIALEDQEKTTLLAPTTPLLLEGCHLAYAMLLQHFNVA